MELLRLADLWGRRFLPAAAFQAAFWLRLLVPSEQAVSFVVGGSSDLSHRLLDSSCCFSCIN